ncbi:MAG: GMC family oxidoreductase N-terminal domain-containing protein [Geminicoccaceae bacterium]
MPLELGCEPGQLGRRLPPRPARHRLVQRCRPFHHAVPADRVAISPPAGSGAILAESGRGCPAARSSNAKEPARQGEAKKAGGDGTMAASGSRDFVIAGSGSSACVAAMRLVRDLGARVLLIERGPREYARLMRMPAGYMKYLARELPEVHHTAPQERLGGRGPIVPQARCWAAAAWSTPWSTCAASMPCGL